MWVVGFSKWSDLFMRTLQILDQIRSLEASWKTLGCFPAAIPGQVCGVVGIHCHAVRGSCHQGAPLGRSVLGLQLCWVCGTCWLGVKTPLISCQKFIPAKNYIIMTQKSSSYLFVTLTLFLIWVILHLSVFTCSPNQPEVFVGFFFCRNSIPYFTQEFLLEHPHCVTMPNAVLAESATNFSTKCSIPLACFSNIRALAVIMWLWCLMSATSNKVLQAC